MTSITVTIDLDWACEAAIEYTLDYFFKLNIKPTIFTTHYSQIVESLIKDIDVGLHPYFSQNSSQGSSIKEVVKYVMDLPHNIPAFRCHRFGHCNLSNLAMVEAGMSLSSNVCTDLEIISPFRNRFGLIEVPIFMEDGGYLWRNHPLQMSEMLVNKVTDERCKVILIHPMHFAINTPNFKYMHNIKQSVSRAEWQNLTIKQLRKLEWHNLGIRNLITDVIKMGTTFPRLSNLLC